jgi:hypothetical protein
MKPRMGCCFQDSDCSYRCYRAQCLALGEGMCKDQPPLGKCWGDRDCPNGGTCAMVTLCGCAENCLLPDSPGTCIASVVR